MLPERDPAVERNLRRWAASGAMALTGRESKPPLGPPAPLVSGLDAVAAVIEQRTTQLGQAVTVDPLQLLGERAAIAALQRHGDVSCGGSTRLLPSADGWVALTLARDDDIALVPAWLGRQLEPEEDHWVALTAALAHESSTDAVDRGRLLGLPVAVLPADGEVSPTSPGPLGPLPVGAGRHGDAEPTLSLAGVRVADLSSLWAGPLCGALLVAAGAEVIKIESIHRPDGARRGPAPFYDLLNAGKRSVALDLASPTGRSQLGAILGEADAVIEGSRPRALRSLGIDATQVVVSGRPRVWLSITGHGREGAAGERVAFGDDAAVAGGLVAHDDLGPVFCADAVADPITGLVAAAAALDALAAGGRWLLDVPMARVAAQFAGPTLVVGSDLDAVPPKARARTAEARPLGVDTDEVLTAIGASR